MKSFFFTILFVGLIIGISLLQNANAQIALDTTPYYYNDNGNFIPYKLIQTANTVTILTKQGSYIFDKNSCSISFYNNTSATGTPIIGKDSYSVLASQGNTGIWNPVSIINNAACNTVVSENAGTVTITGTKAVSGAGVFSINYTKPPIQPLKLTFSATNNNPAWTNYHIGMSETLEVPRNIWLGNQTYDLSQYNNTVLNRNWITNHNSQLIHLTTNSKYDMGIGWNNVNQVTIHWINNKASLVLDYTYNTQILSPGNTITVDPSITSDTSATCNTDGATTCNITIGSNSNRILIAHLHEWKNANSNSYAASTVKIGTQSFTKLLNKTGDGSSTSLNTEVWYLINPPTGAQTVTITWSVAPSNSIIGLVSLYNVNQTNGIKTATANSTGGANTQNPLTINITPTQIGSWILAEGSTSTGIGSPNKSAIYTEILDSGGAFYGSAQYNSAPTIGSKNSFTWSTTTSTNVGRSAIAYEVLKVGGIPSTPTLTHANTLNSTAIKLDWPSVTNATWYQVNYTTPFGGTYTKLENSSATTYTANGLTPGTQYAFKVQAGNSSSGSSFSNIKSNYTTNVAPTSPLISSITSSGARVTVTNPSGNFSGYLIYQVQGNGANYTLAGTSSNTTNHFDFTGLNGNTKHTAKLSTRYAVGTNSSGVSSNSTTVTWYTIPNPPTGLSIVQTRPLIANLTWTAASDNGTVLGFKIERSNNGGSSWSTIVANTTTSIQNYNDTLSSAGTYTYRISTIKYGGTSNPSSIASKSIWNYFTVTAYHNDNATAVYGSVLQTNSTSSNNQFTLISGVATIPGISQKNNFSINNALINFIVGKQYNYNTTTSSSLTMSTHDYNVDCPSTGTGNDIELWTNETNGHKITTFTTPTCYANDTVKWITKFTANGNNLNSFNTNVYIKILNATFLNNATLKWNTTSVTTALTSPYIVSASIPVGTGIQTRDFNWSMNLTVSPAYTPANFTVGHISISGTNKVTAPITFTTTPLNASTTQVTVTFPSTYTMAYQAKLNTEQQILNYSGLPVVVDTPSLGLSQSTFIIKNPKNDTVTLFAHDTITPNNATLQMTVPVSSIPFVSQIAQFKAGAFGTTAQIGSLDLVTFIVIIIAFIGMNRVNETIGVMLCVMIIAVMSFFGLIAWPTTMVAAVALVVLITITSTRKLPWS